MVIDTSAVAAIVFDEPDAARFVDMIASSDNASISAATLVETGMVVEGRLGRSGSSGVARLLDQGDVTVVAVDGKQAELALAAWRRFGKRRHPAALNLGDCFSYALAKSLGEPLLFKGEDFRQTDIASALS